MAAITLRERIYVPEDAINNLLAVQDHFIQDLFNEEKCEPCEYFDDRPCETCENCPAFLGRYQFFKEVNVKGVDYLGFPYGKKKLLLKLAPEIKELEIQDLRPNPEFRYPIRFLSTLRDYQEEAQEVLLDKLPRLRSGILVAPPRSGKTVMGISLMCELGLKTLILANQNDLLEQFYETIMGSDVLDPMTNIPELERKKKRKICAIAHTLEDFLEHDVVLSTYQTFLSAVGKSKLQQVKSLFGLVMTDEIHRFNARHAARVLSSFNCRYSLGLTATPKRKDAKDVVMEHMLGGILHTVEIPTLTPTVTFHETGCKPKRDYSSWVYFLRWQERQESRRDMIVQQVVKDVKAGHSVAIPCAFKSQVLDLVKRINAEFPKVVAAPFMGGGDRANKEHRRKVILNMRSGKLKVVVGIRSILSTGINIPRLSCMYQQFPISNPPQFQQEIFRILTPMEGKKDPIVRFFVDNASQSRGCLRTCLFSPEYGLGRKENAKIAPDQWKIANKYTRKGKIADVSSPRTTKGKDGKRYL